MSFSSQSGSGASKTAIGYAGDAGEAYGPTEALMAYMNQLQATSGANRNALRFGSKGSGATAGTIPGSTGDHPFHPGDTAHGGTGGTPVNPDPGPGPGVTHPIVGPGGGGTLKRNPPPEVGPPVTGIPGTIDPNGPKIQTPFTNLFPKKGGSASGPSNPVTTAPGVDYSSGTSAPGPGSAAVFAQLPSDTGGGATHPIVTAGPGVGGGPAGGGGGAVTPPNGPVAGPGVFGSQPVARPTGTPVTGNPGGIVAGGTPVSQPRPTTPGTTPDPSVPADAGGAVGGGGIEGQYEDWRNSKGFDPATLAAIQNQSAEAARGASDSATADINQRFAGTGNEAGFYAGRSGVARGEQQAMADSAQKTAIADYSEGERLRELGTAGEQGLYTSDTSDINNYLAQIDALTGRKRSAGTTTDTSGSGVGFDLSSLLSAFGSLTGG